MNISNNNEIDKMINPLVMLIPHKYLEAVLALNRILKNKNVEWALSGDLGEALETVHVEPDCIEIVTSLKGVQQIYKAVQEYKPKEIELRIEVLPKNALIEEKEHPVKIRSYFFEFSINNIKIKVYGDLQYQISDWEWGDKIEFKPDYISVIGQNIAVVPLELKYELYLGLGWKDRAEKVWIVLSRKFRGFNLKQTKMKNHVH